MEEHNEIKKTIEEIEDYMIPFLELDSYEKSLYYYLFRHSRLIGKKETIFIIGSASKTVGITEFTARDRLRKLNSKGCIKIEEVTKVGVRVSILIPNEIENCVKSNDSNDLIEINIEDVDFYNDLRFRELILNRENNECFYCLKKIKRENYVLDHLISQVNYGNNSYKNIVASCHECNSIKSGKNGDDFIRTLYRKGILSLNELEKKLELIEKLINGELKPEL